LKVNEETSGISHLGEFMSHIIIHPSNSPTCQVEIEDPSKEYEAVIRSVGNKFKALLNRLSCEKIKINVTHHLG